MDSFTLARVIALLVLICVIIIGIALGRALFRAVREHVPRRPWPTTVVLAVVTVLSVFSVVWLANFFGVPEPSTGWNAIVDVIAAVLVLVVSITSGLSWLVYQLRGH